jgi:short-subunit dehydrogenase involved in D-alanine esterification of teichoic acids
MNAAFEALRQHARNHHLKLTEFAPPIVRGDVELGAVVARSAAN